ncbi:hypothetical protein HG263_21625 [Pseudoalteromonas sp. JBTF-M23]|uniref:Bacteriophage Mu GpT domain-containing protein n=1 Tax=Pseudoalteromonas caenipelagi TaxID=2726988 RepID=A0A849VN20_9GAMM|nr:Mu-like prophage major head subunit gpT family protein [Pseudoalteromonas caenipelagi]NOU53104.1 hypothetical protein [Pseudoalteromonas caenipelagi]
MDITNENLEALQTAVVTAFNEGLETRQTHWQKIATEVPSNSSSNTYPWLGAVPMLREWLGDRQVDALTKHSYEIKNKTFEKTLGIPLTALEDDQYGTYMPLFKMLGDNANKHPDILCFNLLKNGFETSCYDNQNFFDTDHPVGPADNVRSVSNMQDGSGNPWFLLDTTRPLKPLIYQKRRSYDITVKDKSTESDYVFSKGQALYGVDGRSNAGYGFWQLAYASKAELNGDNLDAAIAAMMGQENDEGVPLDVSPNILICGPTNRAAANKTVKALNKANGESNTNHDAVEVLVVPWLK